MTPVIVVHGGAGRVTDGLAEAARAGVHNAALHGQKILLEGGSAQRAVVAAVRQLEDDPTFNAGRGACMTDAGTFEMDAGIMRSVDLRSGAVGAVPDVGDAILVAQAVMEHGRHRFLVGEGAVAHARAHGLGRFDRDWVWTEKGQRRFDRAMAHNDRAARDGQADTVGAVAIDRHGNTCSGCSTGGVLLKRPGRIGDSPLCGSGFYAAPGLGAAGATGMGEAILTHVASFAALLRVAAGEEPNAAARSICQRVAALDDATCGIILVTPDGRTGIAHESDHMSWARAIGDTAIDFDLTARSRGGGLL
jgi:beta-aspartyl-peptidase (threonine type)